MSKLDRHPGESIYDYEDRIVRHFVPDACMERTTHGVPWAMPCTLHRGHDGECRFDNAVVPLTFEITRVT